MLNLLTLFKEFADITKITGHKFQYQGEFIQEKTG